jgi:hypothetical protein
MHPAQLLLLAGLAAAQSTTITISDGISATVVLPEWNTAPGGAGATIVVPGVGTASVSASLIPTAGSVGVGVGLPETTATVVVDVTEIVSTVTASGFSTALSTFSPSSLLFYVNPADKGCIS